MLVTHCLLIHLVRQSRKKRRLWRREWLARRALELSVASRLVKELALKSETSTYARKQAQIGTFEPAIIVVVVVVMVVVLLIVVVMVAVERWRLQIEQL
ncbi:hypothetical protein E2C01_013806 [Portunus trituberculatus]|uniref:Uncharacterized protein n=1 Tax=Portunus trituberculatus TaxID=210409 RepID=A0A5B7DI14_PORTR|nr:hypothetical protein [Portunus trituberculatus]